ncbi:MAG: S16 family serine protease [Verrucomicrobiota bacterium]
MESISSTCGSLRALAKLFCPVLALAASSLHAQYAPDGSPLDFKLRQTFVNGLLVMPLASGLEAGQASKMNATSLPGYGDMRFSQTVGVDMQTALKEVQKFMAIRHPGRPQAFDLEISFEEKYTGKDGPSAAVACGLLMESAITGKTWDPEFAVTGDMNADGSVQPIGGVAAKIRGATNGSCKVVAVPAKNEASVMDVLLLDGPMPLLKICVFSLKSFDEAVALASQERDAALGPAISEFGLIRDVCLRDPRAALGVLKSAQGQARLQAVLEKAPHCLSAKHLLMHVQGRTPKTLSLAGSIQAVDTSGKGLVEAVKSDEARGGGLAIQEDEVRTTLNTLRNLRPKLDSRVWPYVDAMLKFGEVVRAQTMNPARSGAGLENFIRSASSTGTVMQTAKKALFSNPEVVEELGL